jgi:hypothetical protein
LNLADQVEALANLVRVLIAIAGVQLLVTVWLARRVSRLRLTVRALARRLRELGGTVDDLDQHVREVLEPDLNDASTDAGLALELVTAEVKNEAPDSVRDFIRRTERPRANGGE